MTVRELIRRSLLLINVLAEGENPSADMQDDAFSTLKEMIESWSTDSLLVPVRVREEFSLVSGQHTYTFGASGDFNSIRPMLIERAAVIVNGQEMPVQVLTKDEWANVPNKTGQSGVPQKLYAEGTNPLETVHVYFVPSDTNKLVLYSMKPLTAFSTVNDSMEFPPGYTRAIRSNLAIELAPEYGKTVSAELGVMAQTSLANVKRMNIRQYLMQPDAVVSGNGFNILTGG